MEEYMYMCICDEFTLRTVLMWMRLSEPEFSRLNHWSKVRSGLERRWETGMDRLPKTWTRSLSFTWKREWVNVKMV